MKQLIFALFLLFVYPVNAAVKATVNQSVSFEGDPITLIIETNKNNNMLPDLSPLKKDFLVLSSSASSQINIINGRRSFKKTWSIELKAKKKGVFKIPEIKVGNDTTKSINVTIEKLPPEVAAETNKHIFIQTSVGITDGETYVQQQIPYTVKLFYDSSMQSGEFLLPEIEDVNMRQLETNRRYQVVRAGKKFTVIEKHFVISPEKSGKLQLPGITVKGRIALSGGDSPKLRNRYDGTDMLNKFFNDFGRGNPFDRLFNRRSIGPSRPFSISSETINVNVLPVPKEFTGKAWLPAENLIIHDSWKLNPPELKVGEPVMRTLTLQVKGLSSSQIPQLEIPKPIGIKVYPEQAETDTPNDGKTIYGIQRVDISYIPNKQGKVTIPEISVDWWDVKAKKQKTFTLPEWGLNVAAGISTGDTDNIINKSFTEPMNDVASNKAVLKNDKKEEASQFWNRRLITAISVILLLILSALVYQRNRKKKLFNKLTNKNHPINIAKLRARVLTACKNNDNKLTASALLKFISSDWGIEIQSLGILATKFDKGSEHIVELEKSLYGAEKLNWDGSALSALIEKGINQNKTIKPEANTGLAPLYPIHSSN
ncbi:MAG: BatD family protein [Cocleimonas sp.]